MLYPFRQLVAVLLAIWLPLFSGNALAVSISMQTKSGDCHVAVVQTNEHHSRHASTPDQHAQHFHLAAIRDRSAGAHDQKDSSHKDCSDCQLACCGYMATDAFEVAEIQPSSQLFILSSTQFQSFTTTPLDPPPLARA